MKDKIQVISNQVTAPVYRILKDSIRFPTLLSICVVHGIIQPMKSGISLNLIYGISTHNPWVVLQTVSKEKFKEIMSDPVFRKKVD